VTETSRSADSVEVGLSELGEVKVYDNVDRDDINSTSEQVCADETACLTVFEVVEDPVPICLGHP
jgi:hypothetical protein